MSKTIIITAFVLTIALGASALYYFSPTEREARFVEQLVAQNVSARGGETAWRRLDSIRLTGLMELGKKTVVPYTLEKMHPNKMRLAYVFNEKTAIQSTDGNTGWKSLPFLGRSKPEPMTVQEQREAADTAEPAGLLFDYNQRGSTIEFIGQEQVGDREAHKLKVTLPQGTVRWVFLDTETALEIKLETRRTIGGKERRVETFYKDWQLTEGLLIARRQETKTEGDDASHFLTVDEIVINPAFENAYFSMPADIHSDDASHPHPEKKTASDEHAAHKAEIKKPIYSVSKEQYNVPALTLIDQTGDPVDLPGLLNSDSPLAMNFIFTTCTTICSVMTATFAKMRKELGEDGDRLRMVSISIDPEYDRPEVLHKYAEEFGVGSNWTFLTGAGKDISQVLHEFKNSFGSKMNHQPVTLLKKPDDSSWTRINGLAMGSDLAREVRTRLFN